jgi:Leucine-rich repeat (LRR) protein
LKGLSKSGDNGNFAYVSLRLGEKEIDRLWPVLLNYREVRYLDLSGNSL